MTVLPPMNSKRSTCEHTREAAVCSCMASGSSRPVGTLAVLFEEQGYTTLAPSWPDDQKTVEQANTDPQVFAHKR